MSENTDELENKKEIEEVLDKSEKETKLDKEDLKKVKEKKSKIKSDKIENKSIQNIVIENIKNFISKIIEMQEKVKKDEEEEKVKKLEEEKLEQEEEERNNTQPKYLLEYYDLPYRYNETVVKILAQTPKRLFVYWDIADKDRQTYLNAFGENFFNDTYPVLLLHNEDKNYTKEITINDFANSWYLDIPNPKDKYTIQLGRKFKSHIMPQINRESEDTHISLNNDYLFIAMSNELEVPNDHILFEEFKPYVRYRNVKTGEEVVVDVSTTLYQKQIKKLYDKLYDGKIEDERYDMLNPSSRGVSGMFR